MNAKRIPKLPFEKWSAEWKDARHMTGEIDRVVDLWRKMPSTHRWTRDQLVEVLGFRKNNKEDAGEQKIERLLLGPKGKIQPHSFLIKGRSYNFEALRHAVALSKHKTGQVIADAVGKIQISGKWHPLAIEIKVTQGDCWSAVVQNMQQVRMLRAQGRKTLNQFHADGGVWGMVLAPVRYFDKRPSALRASQELLERLRRKTHLRIALCYCDSLRDKQIECFWSNWTAK